MHGQSIRLNPNYQLLPTFPRGDFGPYTEKLQQLAAEIGNCLLKVSSKPSPAYLRKLKKFFIKTNWFKKVRIIHSKLYLFRRKGRYAVMLTRSTIYQLKSMAKQQKLEKLKRAL